MIKRLFYEKRVKEVPHAFCIGEVLDIHSFEIYNYIVLMYVRVYKRLNYERRKKKK